MAQQLESEADTGATETCTSSADSEQQAMALDGAAAFPNGHDVVSSRFAFDLLSLKGILTAIQEELRAASQDATLTPRQLELLEGPVPASSAELPAVLGAALTACVKSYDVQAAPFGKDAELWHTQHDTWVRSAAARCRACMTRVACAPHAPFMQVHMLLRGQTLFVIFPGTMTLLECAPLLMLAALAVPQLTCGGMQPTIPDMCEGAAGGAQMQTRCWIRHGALAPPWSTSASCSAAARFRETITRAHQLALSCLDLHTRTAAQP